MSILGAVARGLSGMRNLAPSATPSNSSLYAPALGLFGQGKSASLKAYSTNPVLFPIVSTNANKTAAVDWHMHRTKNLRSRTACEVCGEEGAVNVPEHPALYVWNSPNPAQNRQEFVEAFQQHVELAGEAFWILEFVPGTNTPMYMWLRQPHLMYEVPDDEIYQPSLKGWLTKTCNAQTLGFELEEVIQIKMPNPDNPYRGVGAVQAVAKNLGYQERVFHWQNALFENGAQADGMLSIPGISPEELKLARSSWEQRHRGVTNAGKIAWLNHDAKWTSMQYAQKDMQVVEGVQLSEETVRRAFNFPKWYLGEPEGSNKASSDNAKDWYNSELLVPRLERIRQVLNNDFLPLFGTTGSGVQFVYTSPVEGNTELKNATRESQARTFQTLVNSGVDPEDAAWQAGLPPLRMKEEVAA